MGRYYSGDIEGKFWFGVQSSEDPEFFGAVGSQPNYIDYYIDDSKRVEEGIKDCLYALGEDKQILDDFFNANNGYNEEMIIDHYKALGKTITTKKINELLVWYARLGLGEQIYQCVKENGQCNLQAEL